MKRSALALVLLAFLPGCGGGSDSPASPLVGTWRATSIQVNNAASNTCPATVAFDGANLSCGASDTTTFRNDGTFSDSGGVNGTYSFNGSTLILQGPVTRTTTVAFVGNTATLTLVGTVDTARLAYVKQ